MNVSKASHPIDNAIGCPSYNPDKHVSDGNLVKNIIEVHIYTPKVRYLRNLHLLAFLVILGVTS